MHSPLHLSPEVRDALANHRPVVALESTSITHGLPRPINPDMAQMPFASKNRARPARSQV